VFKKVCTVLLRDKTSIAPDNQNHCILMGIETISPSSIKYRFKSAPNDCSCKCLDQLLLIYGLSGQPNNHWMVGQEGSPDWQSFSLVQLCRAENYSFSPENLKSAGRLSKYKLCICVFSCGWKKEYMERTWIQTVTLR
jgi:hypothetical protein